MRTRIWYLCLFGLMLAAGARAGQWFTVASPGAETTGMRVEVDLESVHPRDHGGEAVIRVTSDLPQGHSAGFQYLSYVASAQFDCRRRTISLSSAAYYAQPAGKGARLGADSSGKQAGMPPALLDSIPATARRALLKATCATTQS